MKRRRGARGSSPLSQCRPCHPSGWHFLSNFCRFKFSFACTEFLLTRNYQGGLAFLGLPSPGPLLLRARFYITQGPPHFQYQKENYLLPNKSLLYTDIDIASVSVLVLKMWRASYMNHHKFSPFHGLMQFFFAINSPVLWNQVVSSHN